MYGNVMQCTIASAPNMQGTVELAMGPFRTGRVLGGIGRVDPPPGGTPLGELPWWNPPGGTALVEPPGGTPLVEPPWWNPLVELPW